MAGASGSQDALRKKAFDVARRGDLNTLQETVESGFDPKSKEFGKFGKTVLHEAAKNGHLEVVKYLIARNAPVDVRDAQRNTPLHLAAENGHLAVVDLLIGRNAPVDVRDEQRNTPLHLAACRGHLAVVDLLIGRNAPVDVKDAQGNTPLHLAVWRGHLAVVDLLIGKNAPVDVRGALGNTPLHLAAKNGHLAVADLLIGRNAPVDVTNERDCTPLHQAAQNGHLAVVDLLIGRNAPVDVRDAQGNTPLHLAAELGRLAVVDLFIRNRVPVDARNIDGRTPLHLAGSKEVCRILVEKGKADIAAVDLNLWRPLHFAVIQNDKKKISYLLEKGADVTSKDINGDTPCHVAADFNMLDLLQILLPYMNENLCNGQNQTVYDLINQHCANPKDSNDFIDLLKKCKVLQADRVMLDELPQPLRMETDDLLQYSDDRRQNHFEKENLVTYDEAQKILNELQATSVEAKEKYLESLLERFAHPRAYWTKSGQDGYELVIRV